MKLRFKFLSAALVMIFMIAMPFTGKCMPPEKEYYEVRVYHITGADQEQRIDAYLKDALLPALHRMGIAKVGVFKPRQDDSASQGKIFVLIPYKSLQQFDNLNQKLAQDKAYNDAGAEFINATFDNPAYKRIERILARAFPKQPKMETPNYTSPKTDRVYELRSYESATEKQHENKVKMFNDGNEVGLFKRLGFNAVFYSQVVAGCSMPNLMYMTTFENKESHDAHWKSFGADPEWKTLSTKPEYQHNVSHQDIYLLYPADYSDY